MNDRMALVKRLPCLACLIEGCEQPMPTEVHHLNLDGKAGQKRLGNDYTIPLCSWHHRSEPAKGETKNTMPFKYGPSLAGQSKLFRFTYGSDDQLLALTNLKLERVA